MKKNNIITFTSLIEDLRKTLSREQLQELDLYFMEYLKRRKENEKNVKKL